MSKDDPPTFIHHWAMQFLKIPHFGPKTAKKWFSGHISGTVPPRTKIFGVLRPSGIGLIGQAIKIFCPLDLAAAFTKIPGIMHLKINNRCPQSSRLYKLPHLYYFMLTWFKKNHEDITCFGLWIVFFVKDDDVFSNGGFSSNGQTWFKDQK